MLKIGDFSKLSRISIRMLRHYDEIGLLVPQTVDEWTGYRYYSESQLPLAARIQALKEMGFGLSVITELLKVYGDPQSLREYLQLRKSEILDQAEKTNRQLRILETTINRLGKDETGMEYNVTLKEIPQRYVASVRQVIPAYEQEGTLWQQMMTETAPQKLRYANPCYSMAVFHDAEHKEQTPDVEIQMAVEGKYQNTEHVVFQTVPAVQVASAIYQGSYDQVTEVNRAVANWVRDNGYVFSGPMFCIYHVSPAQTNNPEELVTEVCYPVEKS
ncbi:MerR family transcriptional regulator [Clostridium minihomine]|uniref:MerR family transcriptional regulator n=1 Tax=Clostridium minihomine TaxID=2045012 RepID=UPI000C770109|nr:MerR family transcriptional regulator [Clostridium minihomine]